MKDQYISTLHATIVWPTEHTILSICYSTSVPISQTKHERASPLPLSPRYRGPWEFVEN